MGILSDLLRSKPTQIVKLSKGLKHAKTVVKTEGNTELSLAGIMEAALKNGAEFYIRDENGHKKPIFRKMKLFGAAAKSALIKLQKGENPPEAP